MGILMRRRCLGRVLLPLLLGVCLGAERDSLPGTERTEEEMKSAMLYNFIKFVEWPANALGENGTPLAVGVLGNEAFVAALNAALQGKTVSGHPLTVRRLDASADPKGCLAIYLGSSDNRQVARILQSVGRSPILTLGERAQFSRQGGIISFIRDGNRVRFEINLDAAERAGLQLSSKLLRLGTVWREAPPEARN